MTVSKRRMRAFAEALGRRVATLRTMRGLTQEALAEKLDSARSVVNRIERGTSVPSLNRLVEIADALGVDVGALFDGADVRGTDPRETEIAEIAALLRQRPIEDARLVAEIARVVAGR